MFVYLWVADVAPRPPQVKIIVGVIANSAAIGGNPLSLLEIIGARGGWDLIITAIGILAASTDLSAPDPEAVGNSAASQANECQQRRGPLVTKSVVHLLSEQNNTRTPETSDTCLGGKGRSSLVLVGVDQVVVCRVVKEDEAEANGEATQSRADPDEICVRGPCEDEQANGNAPARDHHGNQANLRRRLSVVFVDHLDVVLVDKWREDRREKDTDGQGDEHQTSVAGIPSLTLLEDNGESNEEHVKQAVENAHVQRNEEDDELLEEQLEGSDHENSESLAHRPLINVLFGNVALITSSLTQLLSAASKDCRRVSFGDGEGDENPDDTSEDDLDVVQPAPASTISKEATNKRANWIAIWLDDLIQSRYLAWGELTSRSNKGSGRKGGHGNTTLLVPPQIRKRTADQGHRGRKGDAIDGTADDQGTDIL